MRIGPEMVEQMGAVLFAYMAPAEHRVLEFDAWYPEHIAGRLGSPGFLGASLFTDGAPPRRRVTVYHLGSVHALTSDAYAALRSNTREETEDHIGGLSDFVRVVGRVAAGTARSESGLLLPHARGLTATAVTGPDDLVRDALVSIGPVGSAVMFDVHPEGSNIEATHLILADERFGQHALNAALGMAGCQIIWTTDMLSDERIVLPKA